MSTENTSGKDIRWINYIRAICTLAIYYIHAQTIFDYSVSGVAKYIFPFYVNAFFFVSGYLFFKKQINAIKGGTFCAERKRFLTNIFFRMIVSSIVFAIIEYIPSCLLQHNNLSILSFAEKTILGNTFWFISALVIAELLLYCLVQSKIQNMMFYFFSCIVCFTIGWFIADKNFLLIGIFEANPWHFEKGLMASLFLVVGGIYWKYEETIDRVLRKPYVFVALLLSYIIPLTVFSKNIRILISMNDVNILGVGVSIISILILIRICKMIRGSNRITEQLNKIGKHTIGFYFVCGAVPKVLVIVLPKILPKGNMPYMLFGFILSFLLAYIIVFSLEKYCPFLFDFRKGIYHKTKEARK